MVFDYNWSNGTVLELDFEMSVKLHQSHPLVIDNVGRLAVSYGPSIYCGEELKLGLAPQLAIVDLGEEIRVSSKSGLDGSPILLASVLREKTSPEDALYEEFSDGDKLQSDLSLIPYRTWNAKGKSFMQVWLRHN